MLDSPSWKQKSLRKSLKAPNEPEIHAHDEWMETSDHSMFVQCASDMQEPSLMSTRGRLFKSHMITSILEIMALTGSQMDDASGPV